MSVRSKAALVSINKSQKKPESSDEPNCTRFFCFVFRLNSDFKNGEWGFGTLIE